MLGQLRDRRGKRVKTGKQKNDDYYRLRIVMFLRSFGESRISDFLQKKDYGISSINKVNLKTILDKMSLEGWIKRTVSLDSKNVKKYSLDKQGFEIVDFIIKLRDTNKEHPLFDFEMCKGIRSLGLSDD